MSAAAPTVWALLSYRAGETSQILGLAEALRDLNGIDFIEKRLRYRPWRFIPGLLRRATFWGLDHAASDELCAPWPDLLISAGLKNEPAARRIKELSGGKTKLVFLGRTWAAITCFDLVVATAQYRLQARANLLVNPATLTRVSAPKLAAAGADFNDSLAALPRPKTAVLIGGQSGAWCFGPHGARRLAAALNERHQRTGESFLITSSSRTDPRAAELVEELVQAPARIHLWHRDHDAKNPYFGFLAHADTVIVTGDSVAMLSEALLTGKPIKVFDLGTGRLSMKKRGPRSSGPSDQNWPTRLYRFVAAVGPERLSRDLSLAHDQIFATGQASWLDEDDLEHPTEVLDVRPATVARVLALFTEPQS